MKNIFEIKITHERKSEAIKSIFVEINKNYPCRVYITEKLDLIDKLNKELRELEK